MTNQQGIQKECQDGLERLRRLVLRSLQRRFDTIPKTLLSRLQTLNADQLEVAMDTSLTAVSLQEFTAQLPKVAISYEQVLSFAEPVDNSKTKLP